MKRARSLSLVSFTLLLLAAAPIETPYEDGVVNWTTRVIRAVGVGTPRVLSPTASRTRQDPYSQAKTDALNRLKRVLGGLPIEGDRRLRTRQDSKSLIAELTSNYSAASPIHFSDGSVHLTTSVSFQDLGQALVTGGASGQHKVSEVYTGVVVGVGGSVSPSVRIQLRVGDQTVWAGGAGDRLGSLGLIWVREALEPEEVQLLGGSPLRVRGVKDRAGKATVVTIEAGLADEAFTSLIEGVPGYLVVVVGQRGPAR